MTIVAPETRDRPPLRRRLHFLASPGWLALIFGAIAFALACYMILAPWQFGRNTERSAQNASIISAESTAPVPIATLMSTREQPAASAIWHRVTVTGVFDSAREAYIRLRQDAGDNPASEVVVPLVTADGTRVLVDRGYVAATDVSAGVALPALPAGRVTVIGRVQADEKDPADRPPQPAPDGRMQYYATSSADIAAGGDPVLLGYIQLTADSPAVLSAIGMPQRDSGPFLSYAWQWLTFGATALLAIGFFIYREIADPRDESPYVDADEDSAEDSAADAAPAGDADSPDAAATAANAGAAAGTRRVEPARPGPGPPQRKARKAARAGGFDRSQLYDDP